MSYFVTPVTPVGPAVVSCRRSFMRGQLYAWASTRTGGEMLALGQAHAQVGRCLHLPLGIHLKLAESAQAQSVSHLLHSRMVLLQHTHQAGISTTFNRQKKLPSQARCKQREETRGDELENL